jgi:hypothetical protein
MIDTFALAVSHGLLFFAIWRVAMRLDLDGDAAQAPKPSRIFARKDDTPGA